ncbi:Ribose import permease protein RbsC [Baekduia alba]|uniref:ABC transporter permease n=1 Tax=Baekduia alba TaxID=2997333 RepID=UPI00234121E3|nr:ABC transporter permease [Baekduia alba]WCB95382.1 Ribose import permease protein RbsC [Baekduia alba]
MTVPRGAGVWLGLAGLLVLSAVLAPGTLRGSSISSMLPFAAVLAIVAIGQTLVVQQGGIDLSVPGVMSMAAVVVTRFPAGHDGRLVGGIALALAAAALAGLFTGLVVTRLRVSPIVATLAVNALLAGIVRSYSGGVPTGAPHALSDFALAKTMGISNTVLVAAAFALVARVLLAQTIAGRRFVACGAAPRTALASGIPVGRFVLTGYVAAALCYAAGAILLTGYVQSPSITSGDAYLLAPIAAVVVGGTALGRGKASVIGSVGGALFLSQLTQLILGLGAPTALQLLVQAAVIGVAVGAPGLRPQRLVRRRRAPAAAAS